MHILFTLKLKYKLGYHHFDIGQSYGNEKGIGKDIRKHVK